MGTFLLLRYESNFYLIHDENAFMPDSDASNIYGSYTGLVYLTPLLGGYLSDRFLETEEV